MGRQTQFVVVPTGNSEFDRFQHRLAEALRVTRQSPQALVTAKGSIIAASGNGQPVEHKASATNGLPLVTDSTKTNGLNYAALSLASAVTGVLPIAHGGTNSATALSGSSIAISNGSAIVQGAAGTTTTLLHGNAAGAPTYSAVDLVNDITSTLAEGHGGTNQSTYAQGDLLYASAANTLAKLAKGTSGQLLQIGATIPAWAGEVAWTAIGSFTNSWVNFGGASEEVAGYLKDAGGFVHLRGIIKSGTVTASAFNLPAGYRPASNTRFAVVSNSLFGEVDVLPSGNVVPQVGSNVFFQLDGITFDTR